MADATLSQSSGLSLQTSLGGNHGNLSKGALGSAGGAEKEFSA